MSASRFYITTPIYYVNDKPHIGHAYTTILADVLARYHRLLGEPTHFLTGTDEHGQKVQQAAVANEITPQEQCDQTVVRFQELWEKLEITHDDFIRTTEERHKTIVQDILQDLYDRDEIYSAEYEGWYCVPCERFYTEKDLVEGACPECRRDVEKLVERNYFFRMGKYQEWLISHIESHPEFIQPAHRRQETLGFLRQPLGDLCISRPKSRLSWGIDLPFDADYVTYVWFDALVNYISGVGYGSDAEQFASWWPASYHLIGKDILTTHTVYWPTMLKAIGIELPTTVFAHGWWLVGRSKMSKSLGNVVNPMDMAESYGVDAFRYFLLAEMSMGQDASFTEEIFTTRYNADLANDLGNMASRAVKMIVRNLGGRIPPVPEKGEDECELIETTLAAVQNMRDHLVDMHLDRGLAEVLGAVRAANRYFDKMKPWALAKAGDTEALGRVLYNAAETLRIVSGLLYPVMPTKMTELRRALGVPESKLAPSLDALSSWGGLEAGAQIGELKTLFPRIDVKAKVPKDESKKKKKSEKTPEGIVDLVGIEVFSAVKLKTANVLEAEVVEGASKLLKLQLQVGADRRQVVAGIAKFYTPAELVGRTVVIVANLKPAKIFGIESDGMLLAAKTGKELKLVTTDGQISSGAAVG
ncbi:MAG: methionine--tRNA ligase [Lentisphaeria bacterium]|nr:methionine--tRNA ligase [Lentisphaeria bacterium]